MKLFSFTYGLLSVALCLRLARSLEMGPGGLRLGKQSPSGVMDRDTGQIDVRSLSNPPGSTLTSQASSKNVSLQTAVEKVIDPQPPLLLQEAKSASHEGGSSRELEASIARQFVLYWKQHGILESVYAMRHTVQPRILFCAAICVFVFAQVVALLCVVSQARASLHVLRKARFPHPLKISRLRELIPGISWQDVPDADGQSSSSKATLARNNFYQRRAKDSVADDGKVCGQDFKNNMQSWTTKQRNQYLLSSCDDGGQVANAARLREMLVADRLAGSPAKGPRAAPGKHPYGKVQVESLARDGGAALQSTLNYAARRADLNKRILSLLQQSPELASSLDTMLNTEYDAMLQMDLESDRPEALTEP